MDGSEALLLIVEDDGSTRYALATLIGREGWHILTASSVAEGINLLGTHPACVIIDLQLPDGDGAAVLRRIREQGLASRVVICTAVRDERRLEGVKALAPDAIIHKPTRIDELLQACSARARD